MSKLKLDLEAIQVETFRTSEVPTWQGTVRANQEEFAYGDAEEDAAADTLPPKESCDTCRITCETRCTCPGTHPGCTGCT